MPIMFVRILLALSGLILMSIFMYKLERSKQEFLCPVYGTESFVYIGLASFLSGAFPFLN